MPDNTSTYTQADIDDLLQKMQEERAALIETCSRLTEAQAEAAPKDAAGEEQWSAKEQLAHLGEMQRRYTAIVQAAMQQNGADADHLTWDPPAIHLETAAQHSAHELLDALAEERADTIALLRGLSLEDFHRTANWSTFGELTVMQWVRSFYRHDRQHNAQIQGHESDFQPRFASGAEPDQRRPQQPQHH